MARLETLPHEAIISAFKGKVDYYLWKGIPCARKWPHWPRREPTPTERANQEDFAYIAKLAPTTEPYLIDQYERMAVGTSWTWKDLAIRAYMSGLITEEA